VSVRRRRDPDLAVAIRIAAQTSGIDDLGAEDVCALTAVAREVEEGETCLVLHVCRSDLTTGCVDGRVEVERRRPSAVIVTVGPPRSLKVITGHVRQPSPGRALLSQKRREWWGRVRGADGRQRWIRAVDLRPASRRGN
jgi:hypothetical protein